MVISTETFYRSNQRSDSSVFIHDKAAASPENSALFDSGLVDIAEGHRISSVTYDLFIDLFPQTPQEFTKTSAEMEALLNSDPEVTHVFFELNGTSFTIHAGTGPFPADKIDFSSSLINGIMMRDDNPDFLFTTAFSNTINELTVVIKTGTPDGFYDFSNVHP